MHTFSKLSSTIPSASSSPKQNVGKKNPSRQRPIIPFRKNDRILLVGEGDFSFARSLVDQHCCKNVLATCYDSEEVLYSKYPRAEPNVRGILSGAPKMKDDTSDSSIAIELESQNQSQNQECYRDDDYERHGGRGEKGLDQDKPRQRRRPNVLFSVDARKLGHASGGGKEVRFGFPRRERKRPAWQEAKRSSGTTTLPPTRGGPWDIICFNFPHVGGLSTNVNRQVRANQELLVSFFKACVPLLSSHPETGDNVNEDGWDFSTESGSDFDGEDNADMPGSQKDMAQESRKLRNEPGQIIVTLFEGEPYTLWNIKDLARHAGLRVVTSFRFPWASYRGYSHARTLGEIEAKNGGRGGWRGEDREARMYVFELKEERIVPTMDFQSSKRDKTSRNKRSRASTSDDSD
ncbi:hypothetical protein ANOM_006195 [Aspergillus nomiae NRRL 13137]|uniref:25S rRNA (uridine-N(3))-methyltransferase BMT5-like domain-containing protein n=1 Tax=Aspergillus nomiae NRRL (strain ATCC 15546 / NRRL 13137 / CBS 260.88 / M93) TaxID=1509407 RepID=A0A0L1IZZ1_ASPN3|nr:uncharacterized protein ANOM_006195 [Aspergillus nomiae NRRL 13137]KNG85089.1 hypothetical protein ANOM_006195 [Aspergillus nomiae NRRL 13137]